MITEELLFQQGWRRFGDDDDDPYYKIFFSNMIFGQTNLSGNFNDDNTFTIYNMDERVFDDIGDIQNIIDVNGFELYWKRINKYGSCIELKK